MTYNGSVTQLFISCGVDYERSYHSQIFIVTNGISATQNMRIGNSTINKYISGIFISEETGYSKAQKEYFDYVFSQIPDIGKARVIIIGDSLSSDIQGGYNAGITTCWFNRLRKKIFGDIRPDYEITDLREIIALTK